MEALDIATIKHKSIQGIIALTSRTFIIQAIAFGATFLLTIFLTPSAFGIFYVVSAVISFLTYFSDIGLAAALIQKKEALTEEDLKTTFTIQQVLVLSMCGIVLVTGPYIANFYGLDNDGKILLQALVLAFFLSSLKTIPSILLERALDFKKLVIPQLVETITFYGVVVVLAWKGFGIMSFSYGVVARAVVGLITIYWIAPWRMQIGYSKDVARTLLKFGIPFQLNSVLALLKDDLMTIVLGKLLTFQDIGYIGWAKKWAEVPLRLIMDSVIRVTFPTFSRLQHDKVLLKKAIENALFGLSITIVPISMGLIWFVGPSVSLFPKYTKWEPALLSFSLFVLSSMIAGISTPLTNALNAVGKIKWTLYLMIGWTVATWILTIGLINAIGFNGVAVTAVIISTSIIIVMMMVKKVVSIEWWNILQTPCIGGVTLCVWFGLLRGQSPYTMPQLIFVALTGAILYSGVVWMREKKRIIAVLNLRKAL